MASMNISLPVILKDWVKAQVSDGKYTNASEYVRDLIRRDQDRDMLIKALADGAENGVGERTLETIIAEARQEAEAEANSA